MSDFLTNLVGRSLGSVEVVRPRVPSLFEPHRQGSGLLAARPILPGRDANPAPEAALEGEATTTPLDHRSQPLRAPAAKPRQAPEAEPHAQPAQGFEPDDPPGPPSLIPRPIIRPEPIAAIRVPDRPVPKTEPDSPPATPPATRDSIWPEAKVRTDGKKGTASMPPDWRESRPESIRPLAQSLQSKAKLELPTRAAETRTEISVARPDRAQAPTPPAKVIPSLVAQKAPSATPAIRPPIVPRPGGARNEAVPPASNPAKPSIEISIGRVEVRAVFPEPPVRRAPQARQRPTVSLDDYLNQRNRGKR